jgi:hypothetical protein
MFGLKRERPVGAQASAQVRGDRLCIRAIGGVRDGLFKVRIRACRRKPLRAISTAMTAATSTATTENQTRQAAASAPKTAAVSITMVSGRARPGVCARAGTVCAGGGGLFAVRASPMGMISHSQERGSLAGASLWIMV